MPQLGLQQTMPTLHVASPHVSLNGTVGGFGQGRMSQVAPGFVQMPQVALQHTSPTLHVFWPQLSLIASGDMPHTNWVHSSPGAAQMPQLGLQQS
jgi:hypothetical protein